MDGREERSAEEEDERAKWRIRASSKCLIARMSLAPQSRN